MDLKQLRRYGYRPYNQLGSKNIATLSHALRQKKQSMTYLRSRKNSA